MDETGAAGLLPADEADKKYLTTRQAAFIDVRGDGGAGIFAKLAAGPGRPGQHLMKRPSCSEAQFGCPG
jgi:hypothetical protein